MEISQKLRFNLVLLTQNYLASLGYGVTVLDEFPDAEGVSLPIVVVEHLTMTPLPFELGSTKNEGVFMYNWNIFAINKGQRDDLRDLIFSYFRDDYPIFYDLKVASKKVVLDTEVPLGPIWIDMLSMRDLPAVSEHPFDRYRSVITGTVKKVF